MLAIQGWSQLRQIFKTHVTFTIMLSCRPRDWPWRQQSKKGRKDTDERGILGKGEEQAHSTGHLSKKFLTRLLLSYVFSVVVMMAAVTPNRWPWPAECLVSLLPWPRWRAAARPPRGCAPHAYPLQQSCRGHTNSLEMWGVFFLRKKNI